MKTVHNSGCPFLYTISVIAAVYFFTTEAPQTPQVAQRFYQVFTPIKELQFAQASNKWLLDKKKALREVVTFNFGPADQSIWYFRQ